MKGDIKKDWSGVPTNGRTKTGAGSVPVKKGGVTRKISVSTGGKKK